MPYATTTLAQAQVDLAARLADPTFVRFTQPELTLYLQEALRTFNVLSGGHFRDTGVFPTVAGQAFYDLAGLLPGAIGYTVTDRSLVQTLEYHLLEPPTPTAWTGSQQFTLSDLVLALQRRRDLFLLETGMVLTHSTPTITPSQGGRFDLDQSIITVRRAAFTNGTGTTTPLHREDVWAFNHFSTGWVQQPGRAPIVPFGYSVGEVPPLTMQVVPPPSDRGILDLVTVSRGTILNPATPVVMGVPDDWTWLLKWGALSDLLSKDGLAADPLRAAYCEARWDHGIKLAKQASLVWSARVNNVVVQVASLQEADQYQALWQSVSGSPTRVLSTGSPLVALSPVPNTNPYSVTVDLVRNAPVPVAAGDFLQVGPELLTCIYDYAEHLCYVKEGGPALQTAQPLLDRFLRVCGVSQGIDWTSTPNAKPLREQNQADQRQTPMESVA